MLGTENIYSVMLKTSLVYKGVKKATIGKKLVSIGANGGFVFARCKSGGDATEGEFGSLFGGNGCAHRTTSFGHLDPFFSIHSVASRRLVEVLPSLF
jgi:hypothetical protein